MRNRLLIPVVLVLAVGFPCPAGAAATTAQHLKVHATFRFVPGTAHDRLVWHARNITFVETTYKAVMRGDLAGSVRGRHQVVVVGNPDTGEAAIWGRFTCTCTLAGRSGTVTVEYTAVNPPNYNGSAGHDVIVSGTGGLAHLRGQGTFKQSGNGPVYKDWDVFFASQSQ